jgi:hypothetical protein
MRQKNLAFDLLGTLSSKLIDYLFRFFQNNNYLHFDSDYFSQFYLKIS